MPSVDIVVVAYNSAAHLRACVESLLAIEGVHPIVVDNASPDDSIATLAGLDVQVVALPENVGFARGCNAGWQAGSGEYVLFLNPDARIDGEALAALVRTLETRPDVGLAAPRILGEDGELHYSLRSEPRPLSTFAQALFVHRLLPSASWVDEVIRDPGAYESGAPQEWVSGACVLLRRELLERLGGWDGRFFFYCEDTDLCRRVRDEGLLVQYVPEAVIQHVGGASAPRSRTLPLLAESRIRYAQLHGSRLDAALERAGVGLGAFTHALVGRGGRATRGGHLGALRVALSRVSRQSS